MKQTGTFAHDALDAFVARLFSWLAPQTGTKSKSHEEGAFSDEWERRHIMRELHTN